MHDLVKDATGIDFNQFGDDVKSAVEAARQLLGSSTEADDHVLVQTCPSVGHVLNEVNPKIFTWHDRNFVAYCVFFNLKLMFLIFSAVLMHQVVAT